MCVSGTSNRSEGVSSTAIRSGDVGRSTVFSCTELVSVGLVGFTCDSVAFRSVVRSVVRSVETLVVRVFFLRNVLSNVFVHVVVDTVCNGFGWFGIVFSCVCVCWRDPRFDWCCDRRFDQHLDRFFDCCFCCTWRCGCSGDIGLICECGFGCEL